MTGKPCNCSLPVRDALMTWARAEGIEEPMPYGWKCGYCHGVFTDDEMAERRRWYYCLLVAILKRKKRTSFESDKEDAIYRALKREFGGVA